MTRETFANRIGKKVEADPVTIIAIITALLTVLPTLLSLCPQPEPEPPEKAIKRLCVERPGRARLEIRKAMPKGTKGRLRLSREMCDEIASMKPKDIQGLL